MAKLSGPLLSLDATGTIGDNLGYVRKAGASVARSIGRIRAAARDGRKRPASSLQEQVRARWSAGVDAWNALAPEEKAAYSEAADDLNLTGYNLFMRDFTPSTTTAWDGGASVWDDGLTTWDN